MTAAQRGRCTEPGCDAPPSWLHADHIVPWSRSGRTATRNGQMLCSPANHTKSNQPDPPPPTPPARPGRARPGRSERRRAGPGTPDGEPSDDPPATTSA